MTTGEGYLCLIFFSRKTELNISSEIVFQGDDSYFMFEFLSKTTKYLKCSPQLFKFGGLWINVVIKCDTLSTEVD